MNGARLVIGSTNVVELTALRDTLTDTYPVNATVTIDLLTAVGGTVTGVIALAVPYVSGTGSLAKYRATIPASVALTAQTYTARITATDISGNVRRFDLPCPASTV